MNIKKLEDIIRTFGTKLPVAKVGILGKNATRKDGKETNYEIGKKHEFGEDGLPIRSFLRMPIVEKFPKALQSSGFFEKKVFEKALASGSLYSIVEKLGILGEVVVLEAFETGGFGNWKPSNMKYKKNHQTLVETQQLKDSISSEVK